MAHISSDSLAPLPPSTRDRIIAAAAEVFDRNGYEAASVADIATAASASNGSLYHFAKGKPQLARIVFDEIVSRYHAAMLPAISRRAPGLREVIQATVAAHLGWLHRCPRDLGLLDALSAIGNSDQRRANREAIVTPILLAFTDALRPFAAASGVGPVASLIIYAVVFGCSITMAHALAGRSDPEADVTDVDVQALTTMIVAVFAGAASAKRDAPHTKPRKTGGGQSSMLDDDLQSSMLTGGGRQPPD